VIDPQVATIWLTQEDYDRLSAELVELQGPTRDEGDLRENGGYHAAKDEQGKLEARIRQLTEILREAKVGVAPDTGGRAGPGMIVEVRFAGEQELERFLLGSREGAGHGLEVYSPASPIGKALAGRAAGETVTYPTPTGARMTVDIVSITPYQGE